MTTEKPIVFSGIQPTGNLHLGNYLGAVKNWVDIQNSGEYECYFSIVDYHSLTGTTTVSERRQLILQLAAELLAAGIDPEKSTFFVQSHVPEHTELAWVFSSVTPVAELERMTQFKDKSKDQGSSLTGLLTYPVLQAADILLYKGEYVPVGEDQIQHIELTRDIARWYNNKYEVDYFPETNALITEIPRVKSLLEPTKKMSKSKGANHVIDLADEPEVIEQKIKKAVTATEGGEEAPGVSNLIGFLETFGDSALAAQYTAAQVDGSIRYGDLKRDVSKALADHFAEFRKRRTELLSDPDAIAQILMKGAQKAQSIASKTMQEVRGQIGIR